MKLAVSDNVNQTLSNLIIPKHTPYNTRAPTPSNGRADISMIASYTNNGWTTCLQQTSNNSLPSKDTLYGTRWKEGKRTNPFNDLYQYRYVVLEVLKKLHAQGECV